jgi:hypothetical protein
MSQDFIYFYHRTCQEICSHFCHTHFNLQGTCRLLIVQSGYLIHIPNTFNLNDENRKHTERITLYLIIHHATTSIFKILKALNFKS